MTDPMDAPPPDASGPDGPTPSPEEPGRNDHYPGLRGARLIPTRASRLTYDHLNAVTDHQTIACIHGATGLGKNLAVDVALRSLAPDVPYSCRSPTPPSPRSAPSCCTAWTRTASTPPAPTRPTPSCSTSSPAPPTSWSSTRHSG